MCYYKIAFFVKSISMKSIYYKEYEILYIIEGYKKYGNSSKKNLPKGNISCIIVNGKYGWVPERPKGADCKSVVDDFEGSNPSPSIIVKEIK